MQRLNPIFLFVCLSLLSGIPAPVASRSHTNPVLITFKIVKKSAGMTTSRPKVRLLTAGEKWQLRDGATWSGENEREIFFTIQATDRQAPLPRVAVTAPGIEPLRVIVGRQDVAFEQCADTTTFAVVLDTRTAMELEQVLPDLANGLPIYIKHNWKIRQDGPYRGKPYPEVETGAVLNYLVAAREALRLMGGTGPREDTSFTGNITLMSFEVACSRRHNDYPPHFHIMLWVPGYAGSEVPHFYVDGTGKIVRNRLDIIAESEGENSPQLTAVIGQKQARAGVYEPGKTCRLFDLEGRLALELTVTSEGGLLLSQGKEEEPYLLIGGSDGAAHSVLVKRGKKPLARARVFDDAERGETSATVEHFNEGAITRTVTQKLKYDPFTGLDR